MRLAAADVVGRDGTRAGVGDLKDSHDDAGDGEDSEKSKKHEHDWAFQAMLEFVT